MWKSLLNPVIWAKATPLYFTGFGSFTLGRLLIRLFYKLGIIGNVVDGSENFGTKPNWMPAKMSPALAALANLQLTKLDKMNSHRREIARIYGQELGMPFDESQIYQKFSLLVRDSLKRRELYRLAKSRLHIIIGDWLPRPLYAKFSSTDVYETLNYNPAENPVAEEIGKRIINLPTSVNISPERASQLAKLVQINLGR